MGIKEKVSKTLKIKLFEKKLRDLYSDDTVFIRSNSKMIKKKGFRENVENSIDKMEKYFEFKDNKSMG